MGAQIILCDGFEVVPPPEMNDLIFFGSDQSVSNCDVSTVTTEEDGTVFSGDSSPGGAAEEEWSEAKPFSFYFVKQPVYDDPEIKAKIDEADQEIYRCNKLRIELSNAQKLEKAEVSSLFAQMEGLVPTSEGYRLVFEAKKREFDTLQEALRNLRCSRSSDQLCFTKEELDHLIYIAHYQIEHGSIGLEDEDWVLKDTEKPDGIILNEDSLAQKEASINRVKSLAVELYEVKKELDAITWNISQVSDKMGKIQNNIQMLNLEIALILEKRDKSYARIKMLRIQRDKGNAAFFQSHAVMRKAKELAASGNVRDLEVFASSEVDRFMNQWNNDKAFRDDYVKRISLSLCERQLNRDGRIKDPEVQVVRERQVLSKTMMMGGEKVYKVNREDSSSNSSQDGNVITDKQKKETRKEAVDCNRSSAEESDVIDLEFPVYEKPKKEEEEVDEETLKERKREEQLEKARLAMERKRKLQEKAAAKAAIRAQKDAEKKLKECEKKAKKKAAANSPSESDQSREVINELEKVRTLTASGKEKHQKDRSLFPKQRSFRYKHRGRGTEALPKAILNRRKAHKYWVWGLSSAALACALFLVFLLLR
ncbi:PREDICTED: proton pump-interactor 2 [Camelina sativa]|uniref:Proton pump-interactor 2 n=1 Tax=Camelina sativa TaxID=90675 RepID=A0ABM0W4A4_CAMSA|nr:PREDICTED: proton pump-interactor 2 [Camelina sativa]XP_010465484.1 PREDICTED: proton pump-interactor 2 [Camelina sativa]XP_019092581.1 PREDICTED: proton pump-interactor 2 [Camelina sativa]